MILGVFLSLLGCIVIFVIFFYFFITNVVVEINDSFFRLQMNCNGIFLTKEEINKEFYRIKIELKDEKEEGRL